MRAAVELAQKTISHALREHHAGATRGRRVASPDYTGNMRRAGGVGVPVDQIVTLK